jgi:hypothetical protein
MRTERFSLLGVIGNLLRAALATRQSEYPERWVKLIEQLNQNESADGKAQAQKPDATLPPS